MNEAALLAACDAAPNDPVPRLILADCLEEAGTPGRAVAAKLVRRSAGVLGAGSYEALKVLKKQVASLAKTRPSATAWYEWWFRESATGILELHKALDRRKLARFILRCVRETPRQNGGAVADHLIATDRAPLYWLERFADGHDLTESDWQSTRPYLTSEARSSWELYASGCFDVSDSDPPEFAIPPYALGLADPTARPAFICWVAGEVATRSQEASARKKDQGPAQVLHRRLLHECVPCPFDPEGDE